MRTSTFVVSFVLHALLIGGTIVTRVVANDVLPEPPRATTYIVVTPEVPTVPPPPPARRRTPPVPAVNVNAAPIAEPPDILPEPLPIVDDTPAGRDLVAAGTALPGAVVQGEPLPPPPPRPAAATAPLRVGGRVRPPEKVHHVAPEYPAIARAARVSGVVILEALIAEDGTVRNLTVLRSEPLLDDAALKAVRQWRFTPTLLNGMPVPVLMTVTVAFNLSQ